MKYLITVPVALLGACITFSWNMLFPTGDNEWDSYHRLTDRAYFFVVLCVLCSVIAIGTWIFRTVIPPPWLTAAGLFGWFVPVVTTATAHQAVHKVRYLLERFR